MANNELKIWKDLDIDLSLLAKRRIAIIGYGSQGKAQALNLRDTGYEPMIALPKDSKSRELAVSDGFNTALPGQAVADSDIVVVLAPDHKHQELFTTTLENIAVSGKAFIFAHAMSVHFNLVSQPEDTDFLLVAPHSPGVRMRERYLENKGVTAFIGRTEKSSEQSINLAAAYAGAIGCGRAGLVETSFEAEAIGDIFGEQAVLCGGLSALLKGGYDTLVKAGLPPENAYLECVYQIDLIVDLIKKYGIAGMYDKISVTAAVGALRAEPLIINDKARQAMESLLQEIKSGHFTDILMKDYSKGFNGYKKIRESIDSLAIDRVAEVLRRELDI